MKKYKTWWKTYNEYLHSDFWQEIVRKYNQTYGFRDSRNICLICSRKRKTYLHHWRYPKALCNDQPENLVHICDDCHKYVHIMRNKKEFHWENYFYSREDFLYQEVIDYYTKRVKGAIV